MDTNKYFSLSRIGLVMKRDLMENWKSNLYRFLGPYAGILLVMLMGYLKEVPFGDFEEMVFAALGGIFFIGGAFYASYIMEPMNTQQKRLSYLMLPATQLEKFVSRALYVTVGFTVMMIGALLLAEVTRYVFLPLFDLPEAYRQSVLPYVWDAMTNVGVAAFYGPGAEESVLMAWMTSVLGWVVLGWLHSLFVLGGCRWYKNAFWKTLAIMLVSGITGVIALVYIVDSLPEDAMEKYARWCETYFSWVTMTGFLSALIVLFAFLILLNWWLGYRCFTRSQVIEPKFRLL